jgi:hypothetical protein
VGIGGSHGWRRCVSVPNVATITGISRRRREMKIKCEACGEWKEVQRITAKYCSEKCKKQAQRVSGTKVSGTNSLAGQVSGTKTPADIAKRKKEAMLATDLPEVSLDTPCVVPEAPKVFMDVERDLGMNLKKDLGCYSWSRDGIMIRPDITVQQVHNIARLIHARHGRPCPPFREATSV